MLRPPGVWWSGRTQQPATASFPDRIEGSYEMGWSVQWGARMPTHPAVEDRAPIMLPKRQGTEPFAVKDTCANPMKIGVFVEMGMCSTEAAAAQVATAVQQQLAPEHPVLVFYRDVVGTEQRYLLEAEGEKGRAFVARRLNLPAPAFVDRARELVEDLETDDVDTVREIVRLLTPFAADG